MIKTKLLSPAILTGVALWAGSLALYVSTLAPTLSWGAYRFGVDGGELLAAAKTLGIPHPPGYPTYTLLLKVFATVVPIGDFAYRGNLMSAVLASLSVLMLYAFILRLSQSVKPHSPRLYWIASAVVGAAAFAASPLFWSQATITEVYTLNTLFTGILLLLAARLALNSQAASRTNLALFAFMFGLGLGNHLTLLAVGIPLLFWIASAQGWRRLASPWTAGAFLLGLGIYLYLPIRASQDPPVNWGDADSLNGIAWMLSGRAYQEYVFSIPLAILPDRIVSWVQLAFAQFNPLGVFMGLAGAAVLRASQSRLFLVSLASIMALSLYSLTYGTVDFEVIMIPTFMLFSLWLGVGFLWAIDRVSLWVSQFPKRVSEFTPGSLVPVLNQGATKSPLPWWERVRACHELAEWVRGMPIFAWSLSPSLQSSPLMRQEARRPTSEGIGIRVNASYTAMLLTAATLAALPLASAILNYGSQNQRTDNEAYAYAREIADALPEGAVVLSAEEGQAFSLWYMRFVEDTGRDFAPVAVPLLQFDWYWRSISQQFPDRFKGDAPDDYTQAIRRIVEHNSGDSKVFFTYRDHFLERSFDLERTGNLFRASPKFTQ